MLQSLADLTIPKSHCTIFYKDQNEKVFCRKFYNKKGT